MPSRPTSPTTSRVLRTLTGGVAAAVLVGTASVTSGGVEPAQPAQRSTAAAKKPLTLRQAAPRDLRIGTAVAGGGHYEKLDVPSPFTQDSTYRALIGREFDSVTPENQTKWEFIHPERYRYNFGPADEIAAYAKRNGMKMRGHALVWHSQNPEWLEKGGFSKAQLRAILKQHITTVVKRYRGVVYQWDVANEIFDEKGQLRTKENIWLRELGPGILADAFRWAHAADPDAALFLNDYGSEGINPRTDAYYTLSKQLRKQGVPVNGFGAQAHFSLKYGYDTSLQANLARFDKIGMQTAITELDVRIPLTDGQPTVEQEAEQTRRYAETLKACLAVRGCSSFTLWGFTDRYSWVPDFSPGEGSATVMTEDFVRKYSYYALRDLLRDATPGRAPRTYSTQASIAAR